MKKALLCMILFAAPLIARPPQHSVTLNWQDSINPAGTTYNVYKAAGACSSASLFAKLNAAPIITKTFTDTKVSAGIAYCYAATSYVSPSESVKSPGITAIVPGNHRLWFFGRSR